MSVETGVRRTGAATVAVLAALVVWAAVGIQPAAGRASAGTLTLAFASPIPVNSNAWIGKLKGIFDQYGVTIQIQDGLGANAVNSVVSGQADLTLYPNLTAIISAKQGRQTSIVFNQIGGGSGGTLASRWSSIAELKQHKGSCRIAGLAPGTSPWGAALLYNRALGLDCQIVPIANVAAIAAMQNGQIDASIGNPASFLPLVQEGKLHILIDARDPKQRHKYLGGNSHYPESSFWGMTDNLKSKSAEVIAFIRGLQAATHWMRGQQSSAVASLLLQTPTFQASDPGALQTQYEAVVPFLVPDNGEITPHTWAYARQQFNAWGDANYQAKAPEASFSARIDMSYYAAANTTGTPYNDVLYGAPGPNVKVRGGPGDDFIDVRLRARSDSVTCGPGRDTVLANKSQRVAKDCEIVKRSKGL